MEIKKVDLSSRTPSATSEGWSELIVPTQQGFVAVMAFAGDNAGHPFTAFSIQYAGQGYRAKLDDCYGDWRQKELLAQNFATEVERMNKPQRKRKAKVADAAGT